MPAIPGCGRLLKMPRIISVRPAGAGKCRMIASGDCICRVHDDFNNGPKKTKICFPVRHDMR